MIVVVDCRDSFVWNVVHRFAELGVASTIVPAHATSLGDLEALDPSAIVLSPGPQSPREAGIAVDVVTAFGGRVPILGICLGHQCIAAAYGLVVAPTTAVCHGRASAVTHDGEGLFAGLPSPFAAGRYHALAVAEPPADHPLIVNARLADDPSVVMAVRHRVHPTFGVQFHPESVLTPDGARMLAAFSSIRPSRRSTSSL